MLFGSEHKEKKNISGNIKFCEASDDPLSYTVYTYKD